MGFHVRFRFFVFFFCSVSVFCLNLRDLTISTGTVSHFHVRLYWTGFSFQANIVEEYVLLSALLYISVGLKRTWDQKLSSALMSGQLNLDIIGLMLLTFMTVHLFQFRFADTEKYFQQRPLQSSCTLQFLYAALAQAFAYLRRGESARPIESCRGI